MMPMGIASFSFDLFGISRSQNADGQQPTSIVDRLGKPELKAFLVDEPKDEPSPRDYEHVFWGMFPVL